MKISFILQYSYEYILLKAPVFSAISYFWGCGQEWMHLFGLLSDLHSSWRDAYKTIY